MNAKSKRILIVCFAILGFGLLSGIGFLFSRAAGAIPAGQTRFVAADKFEPIGSYQMVKIGDGDWFRGYSPHASPEECGSEPTVESMPYGTEFKMLIVPSRDVTPREKLQKVITKDGKVIGSKTQNFEGADIMGGETSTCYVDSTAITRTGAMGGGFELQLETGPLPVGRYHFALTSGTEVLSAGDFTITAP